MNSIKTVYLILFCISFIACNNKPKDLEALQSNNDTLGIETIGKIRSIGETLQPEAKKKVENWPEYKQLDQLLTKFYSISTSEALNSSKELANTTQQLKDSLKIERFKQNDILIRINVLNNYALRLSDMANINNIKNNEVAEEIQNILDAFSALNAKINNITQQDKLQEEVNNFEKDTSAKSTQKSVQTIVNKTYPATKKPLK